MRKAFILPVIFFFAFATARSEQAVFSEIMYHPAGTKPEYIEIWNCTMTPLDMAKWRFTDGVSYEFPDFNAGTPQDHFLKPLERIVVSAADAATTRAAYGISPVVRVFGPWTGALENAGERVTLTDKNGVTLTTVKYGDGGRWPKAADGAGHSLVLRNENNPIDSWHNWRQSQFKNGSPGGAEFTAVEPFGSNPEVAAGTGATIFDYGATWKYFQPATDPGTSWRTQAFDDNSWQSGPGLLGFESAPLPPPGIQTPVGAPGPITYLFRKTFTFSGNPAGATVSIDQVLDDGAAYYLNGNLLPPVGYNPGGAWDQTSSRTIGDATEELNAVSGAATGLVNGTNTIAVEVHQTGSGSSDMVFGARLKISTTPSVVINEVKPGASGAGFVEFFNTTASPINLNGYYLSDTPGNLTKFQITTSTVVPANSYATVGFAESNLVSGATTVVYLTQPNGTTVINAISAAMPLDGRSLGRNPAGSTSWFLFAIPTPLAPNGSISAGSASVRLSEAHFGTNGRVDWVELRNTSGSPQPMSGLFLASLADFSDKIALAGSIAGGGYGSFVCDFAADARGDVTLYLLDSQNNVLGVAELEHVAGLDSIQAVWPTPVPAAPSWEYVKTTPEWFSAAAHTRDAANAVTPTTSIVINEIMCDPPSDQGAGEFIELYNKSAAAVNLAGWKLRGGIEVDFGAVSIPAGGYLVVGGNVAYLQSAYPGATIVGNWSGGLGNKGDLIRIIDANGNLADEVDYKVGGDWPSLAAGLGSSLELVHPNMDNSRASAWRDSNESGKTSFQTYTITGTYQQLNSIGVDTDYKELHLFLVGDSHVVVRNVSLRANGSGANIITNGTVQALDGSSASGWLMQGTHWASYVDGSGEIHLIADGHGDNRPNRAEIDATGLTQFVNYTVSFEARWISGKPRLVAQTWDHSIGLPVLLPVPNNLGTAGAANSQATASPLPQVDSVLHNPPVPKPTDAVKVTARVFSATSLTSVQVWHRADDINNANAYVAAPMFDDGTNGDAVAGDGLYTATITAHQVNGRIVQFYVRATASGGATAELPKGGAGRPALWLVDNRTLSNQLRRQRFVMSTYDRDALNTGSGQSPKFQYDFPRLSNHYFNATFIHNDSDVYYNAEIRKSGSPWTRSDGNELSRGKWKVPLDRLFRGREKSTFDNDAEGGSRHHNRLSRYWLYLLGHPVNENEFVYNVVNSDGLTIREDAEPVDGELVARCFPDGSKGQLMRSDDEWWFQDDWNRAQRDADWSYKSTDAAVRYHTEWMLRSREAEYDYSPLTEFFKTVSNASSTEEQLNRVLDPQLTLMMAAVRGYTYDWDSLTLFRGKNGYFYRKPTDGRWMFLHWDSDLAFQDANNAVVGGLAGWATYIAKPWTRRIFNYWLTEMLKLTSGSNSARTIAFLDAEEAASSAYTVDKTFYQTWFTDRRARIEAEINLAGPAYTAPFAVTTAGGTTAANTINLNGTAPSSAFTIVVVGHPEAVLSWTSQTTWQLSGIVLSTGLNSFTLQMLDWLGNVIGTTTYSITKTGNAPPVMALAIDPPSQNAVLGTQVLLDASASYDPDAGALGFGWSVPASGVNVTTLSASSRRAVFTTPGVYSFTATGTDPGAAATGITREITAYNAEDFASFGGSTLEMFWTPSNLEPRDSYSPSAYYSLEDTPNNLVVQVLDNSAKPLNFAAPTHPLLQRPLPTTTDFSLQTDLTLETRRTGTFMTGLYVETVESGSTIRYAFGFDGGNNIAVKRLTSGSITTLVTQASTGATAILRARRVGTQLRFERRTAGVWTTIRTQTLPAGASAVKGGVFVATTAAENVRVAFDYVLLADPANNNTVLNNLRITEVMYHPKAPGMVEFIELRNVGAQTINLNGVKFGQGAPFDAFTFGNVSLVPGQFAVVTNDSAAFLARYGFAATGQWLGGVLADGGESIVLRDADGNPVHDFDYDDVAPWPLTPDGSGPSLEVIDVNGNYNLGTNWRASWEDGGSPGWQGAGPDSDGDGQPDSWEAMFGTGANDPSSYYRAGTVLNGSGQPVLSWPSVVGRNYRVEYCDSLTPPNWQTLMIVSGTAGTTSYTDTTTPRPPQRFYKITALP